MTVWRLSLSGDSGQLISPASTTGGGGVITGGGTTGCHTFLFRTFGTGVQVTFGNLDLLRKL